MSWRDHEVGNGGGTRMEFWRRMGVWSTRIGDTPVEWLEDYCEGRYGYVVIPTLTGRDWEVQPGALIPYIKELREAGFDVVGSQWGDPHGTVGGARLEAVSAATAISALQFDGWIMNGEKKYEFGGLSAAYVEEFRGRWPTLPFGWSPEPRLSLDHAVLQAHGVCYMPQAYPAENHWGVKMVVEAADVFGYDRSSVVPLVQAYPTNGVRPLALAHANEARNARLSGLILYTGNQAFDVPEWWMDLVL